MQLLNGLARYVTALYVKGLQLTVVWSQEIVIHQILSSILPQFNTFQPGVAFLYPLKTSAGFNGLNLALKLAQS